MTINKNKRYQRYFEGYEESATFDENGKKIINVEYVGMYYRADLSDSKRRSLRAGFIVLYSAAVILQVAGGLIPAKSNYTTFMSIFQALSLISSIALLVFLCSNVSAPYKMEISRYKNAHRNFKALALITAFMLTGTFVCSVIGIILLRSITAAGVITAVLYLLAAACCLFIWIFERNIHYKGE